MKDQAGVEIKVGDTIVYATRWSSSQTLHRAEVIAVEPYQGYYSYETERLRVKKDMSIERSWRKGGKDTVLLHSPTCLVIKSN